MTDEAIEGGCSCHDVRYRMSWRTPKPLDNAPQPLQSLEMLRL